MAGPLDHHESSGSSDVLQMTSGGDAVTLPSGRTLDLHRSRWDGVLDAEEYEYCRENGVGLSYDCAQIGWVTQTCVDDSSDMSQQQITSATPADVTALDPEERTLELRGVVEREAARILAEVRQQRMALDEAQERLAVVTAGAMKEFSKEFGLADCDLAHWALESAAADALGTLRQPLEKPHAVEGTTEFAFRPWSPDDAAVYADLLGNPRIWEYLPEPFPSDFTIETARTLIEVGAIGFHHDTLAIEVDGRPIGQCLLRFDRQFAGRRAAEVAYWLGEEHWGKGWMTRVLPVFTSRSFDQHDVDVVYAWIMKDNTASIRVAERAGYRRAPFALEARLAESLRRPGFVRYATYRAEWTTGADLRPAR